MLKLQKKTQFLRKVDRVLCVFRDIASYARNLKVAPPVMAAQGKRDDVINVITLSNLDSAVSALAFLCREDGVDIVDSMGLVGREFPTPSVFGIDPASVRVFGAPSCLGDVDGEPVFAPPRRSVGASLFSVTRPSLPAFLASNLKVFRSPFCGRLFDLIHVFGVVFLQNFLSGFRVFGCPFGRFFDNFFFVGSIVSRKVSFFARSLATLGCTFYRGGSHFDLTHHMVRDAVRPCKVFGVPQHNPVAA